MNMFFFNRRGSYSFLKRKKCLKVMFCVHHQTACSIPRTSYKSKNYATTCSKYDEYGLCLCVLGACVKGKNLKVIFCIITYDKTIIVSSKTPIKNNNIIQ